MSSGAPIDPAVTSIPGVAPGATGATAAPGAPKLNRHAQAQLAAKNAMNKLKQKTDHYVSRIDAELSNYEYANEIQRRTGLPKAYVVLGSVFTVFMMIFFNLGAQFLTNMIAWIYPALASFKAIESDDIHDDTQWLVYWCVIGFANMLEYFSDILLYWCPFYYLFKTAFVLWLMLPQFRGAEFVYERFLCPILSSEDKKAAAAPVAAPAVPTRGAGINSAAITGQKFE